MSGKWFNAIGYDVDKESELIDYDNVEKLALEHKPKLIIAGGSAYSRVIDFKRFREIADKVGAYLMVDMAISTIKYAPTLSAISLNLLKSITLE